MKVLYVAPDFPNNNSCAAHVRANQLLPILAKKVDLYVFGYSNISVNETKNYEFKFKFIRPGKLNIQSMLSKKPRAFFRYAYKEAENLFCDMVEEIQPDVIHFDSIATFGLFSRIPRAALKNQPKTIFHSHDSVTRLYTNQFLGETNIIRRFDLWLQLLKIKQVEKNLYPLADLCIVDSHEDVSFLKNLTHDINVSVLPLGFDDSEYCKDGSNAALKNPNIVFSGAMSSAQSIDAASYLCQEIMPKVWEKKPETNVYLVGGNPAKQISELKKINPRIHVTGFVDSLASYLRGADVYVCPLRLGSGMRTRVVEALACGCSVVATPDAVVGLKKIESEAPWLLADSTSKFAENIISLLGNEKKRVELGCRAAIYATSNYSWNNVTGMLHAVYNDLIKK
ncbi:MAG: glycosyltransferase family 4 protein [Gammaproteobacteria bacterium]|nr:glycosyltransferase family 4 protein [Gammaproteobacteria bacterium]